MKCSEARKLLDIGITPQSHDPQCITLGFHLASCAACRAYHAGLQDQLLADLLAQSSATAPALAATHPQTLRAMPPVIPAHKQRLRWATLQSLLVQALWYGGLALLATFALLTVVVVGSVIRSAFQIHQNVQAMIVATELPTTQLAAPPTPHTLAAFAPTPYPTPAAQKNPPNILPTIATRPIVAPTPTTVPTLLVPASGDAVNVLLLGVDRRPGETTPPRTDAIMIARIEPQNNRIALLSLPRDLVVPIPGYGRSRINNANVFGERRRVQGSGADLACQTVSNLLHIPIDYYMLIDFQGFISAIDAVGGISVDVDRELYDAQFPTMNYGYTVAHFLPGPQQLTGETALMFSRVRHSDSDFARIRRQQQVIIGIMGQLRIDGVYERVEQLETLTNALRDHVQTNMPEQRIIGLAWALRAMLPTQVERYAMRADQVVFGIGADRWAETAKPGVLKSLSAQLMGTP